MLVHVHEHICTICACCMYEYVHVHVAGMCIVCMSCGMAITRGMGSYNLMRVMRSSSVLER